MKTNLFLYLFSITVMLISFTNLQAQTYEEFAKQRQQEFADYVKQENERFQKFVEERDNYIKKMDQEFSAYLKQRWEEFDVMQGKPRESEPKPTEIPKFTSDKSTDAKSFTAKKASNTSEVVTAPKLPILQKSEDESFSKLKKTFMFYGSKVDISYDQQFVNYLPSSINEELVSTNWDKMSNTNYNHFINQMQVYKEEFNLNDWGYYMLLLEASKVIITSRSRNAAIFLQWFFMVKSNYKAKIAYNEDSFYLLLPTINNIYGKPFFTIDNIRYYVAEGKAENVFTYEKDFPEANKLLDLDIKKPLNTHAFLGDKTFNFDYNNETYNINIKYNKSAIHFYKSYPLADITVYFNAIISNATKESLISELKPLVKDKSETEAVSFLLSFVQNAFAYKTDQDQFGTEKFFFPDEIFYYPFSDCEDRSIFFAYLVREVLNLEIIGLSYSGHIATAVHFDSDVQGDFFNVDSKKFVVCDPTFVNAPIGMSMPEFRDSEVSIIELLNQQNTTSKANEIWDIAMQGGIYHGSNKTDVVFDEKGNAYLIGFYNGIANIGGQSFTSKSNDICLVKINSDKKIEWVKNIAGEGNDIGYAISLKNNYLYFTGSFTFELLFDNIALSTQKGADIFLAKYDIDGNPIWIRQAGVDTLDQSLKYNFVANFYSMGSKNWTRIYNENEQFDDYALTITDNEQIFITGSFASTTGMNVNNISFNNYSSFDAITMLIAENDRLIEKKYNKKISGLFAVLYLVNNSGFSLPGTEAQKAIDKYNPSFRKASPNIYSNISRIQFLRNADGVVTIKTDDAKPVLFNTLKINNNSRIKISVFNSGNAQVNILNGITVGKSIIWYDLNFVKLFKDNGDLVFDYDDDHSQKRINISKDILD